MWDYPDWDGDHDPDSPAYRQWRFAGPATALHRPRKGNPRNLPCPTCKQPNLLTRKDQEAGYQCDACADRDERGW